MTATDTPLHLHPRPHHELSRRYRHFFRRREATFSIAFSTLLLAAAWYINYLAIVSASETASNSVTDIVLSNIPVFDVYDLFVYGTFVYGIAALILVLAHPKRIPFAFKAVALFWVIRSVFTTLTHIAPFEIQYVTDFGPTIVTMFFGADLFFSAHVGMPFLGALAFWKERGIRLFFLTGSVYFAAVVLLGHLHYSIDVAAAFFITYTIFHLAEWIFPKDRALFIADETHEA